MGQFSREWPMRRVWPRLCQRWPLDGATAAPLAAARASCFAAGPAPGDRRRALSTAAAAPDESGGRGGGAGGLEGVPLSAEALLSALAEEDSTSHLTPAAVVEWLGRFIVGQEDAKRAVAVAFRNRWRRHRVTPRELQPDISPKNILMIGPTGCGKTEIARRLAQLADAPFVKVEATKFTEVGFHGRDVDSIVRDLLDSAAALVRGKLKTRAAKKVAEAVEEVLVRALADSMAGGQTAVAIEELRVKYRAGELEAEVVEVELPSGGGGGGRGGGGGGGGPGDGGFVIQGGVVSFDFGRMLGGGGRRERRRMAVSEARPLLEEAEVERLFPQEVVMREALRAAQEDGIVFIDEIDKIVTPAGALRHGTDPSSEGVQRDLLPIIEGSTVSTKHGNVSTDHVLFICSGAFHSTKPSDMLAELQGRLPIRVELKGLCRADFVRILREPEYNLVRQQQMLLGAEGVDLVFTDDAIDEIAALAEELNTQLENIGARRLHTVMERLVEDVSFDAPDRVAAAEGGRYSHVVDAAVVRDKVGALLKRQDLSKYIL
ncbi:MAG: P-loop containing nucleoside triphosphate hydrolase protein [Monoraphidium minutum]|nr:MAG: P-loop containing nucleoside triphosphate hydrolase protein [Monoraphidium minutum]